MGDYCVRFCERLVVKSSGLLDQTDKRVVYRDGFWNMLIQKTFRSLTFEVWNTNYDFT
jgi:hypothetical protein